MKLFFILILLLLQIKAEAQTSALGVADSLYTLGNYSKAINEYSKVGGLSAALQIARSYNAVGNYEKAITQYQYVVEEDVKNQLAQFELGKLLLKVNRFKEAKSVFTNLSNLNMTNPEFQFYLGEVNRHLDVTDESLKQYEKAINLDSTHLRSLFQLAKHYTIKQERDNALKYILQGLRYYENDVSLINLHALVLFNDYQYEKAIPLFEKVLELGEDKDYMYDKLAFSYNRNWEFSKAKKAYHILIKRDDTNSQTYFDLASVYQKENKLDSAKIFIKKAMVVQKPVFANGYNQLAYIAREQNDFKTAFKFFKMAHQEDTSDARTYYNIATTYDQFGTDLQKKLVYYQNFLNDYPNEHPYYYETAKKRISELKEEIHFTKD
ncbi:tetratricopeptide repeat protein [Maribacter litoralis]|uniref:Flp pilus assembly protein TadD, contains TPR repeats n=1 Tax=Maribacter litoralis TaxID=2059726 RepID=A0A653SKE5_9FLAO|nr:tetratricopeptide repeat protein [Maribacter litoralis]VXB68336.1 Flp pilus assembly protein TadD, contains TPR repeats [Maribacter litoralis]